MNSRNPSGVRRSPSGVLPEYVEECKVLESSWPQAVGPPTTPPLISPSTLLTAMDIKHKTLYNRITSIPKTQAARSKHPAPFSLP